MSTLPLRTRQGPPPDKNRKSATAGAVALLICGLLSDQEEAVLRHHPGGMGPASGRPDFIGLAEVASSMARLYALQNACTVRLHTTGLETMAAGW